eukprot:Pgem_evm1s12498
MTISTMTISHPQESDFTEWKEIFQLYIAFYKTSLPDDQYTKTWERIINPE